MNQHESEIANTISPATHYIVDHLCGYVISCPLQHDSPGVNYLSGSRPFIVDESPAISRC